MSEEQREQQREDQHPVPLSQALCFGAGTFLTLGAIDLLAHLGPTGLVVGGIVAYVAAQHGPELASQVREALPSRANGQPGEERPQRNRGRSLIDRALGRFPEGHLAVAETERDAESSAPDDDGTVVVDEAEEQHLEEGDQARSDDSNDQPITAPVFPIYPANKTLRLGRVLQTGQRFDPHINMLLGKGAVVAGAQGAGKSNLTGLCAAGAGACGMSLVIFDLKRESYPLMEVLPNGMRAGHPSFLAEADRRYFPLTVQTASQFARLVMEGICQAIIDIPSYRGHYDEVAQVIAAVLGALMDWSERQQEGDRLPCLVITDEAHNFLPERTNLSSMVMRPESFDLMKQAYSRMINTGRSYGYTMLMATQRIANIAKWAIANLYIKVILAHTEKNDLDRCEEEVGKDVADRALVKRLEQGTGIVVGLTKEPCLVRFDRQPVLNCSRTPLIERSHQQGSRAVRPHLTEVLATVTSMAGVEPAATSERAPHLSFTFPPSVPRRPTATSTNAAPTGGFTATLPGSLRRARELYRPGMSHRDLARVMGLDKETAIELMRQLKTRRLIGEVRTERDTSAEESILAPGPSTITVLPVHTEQKPQPTLNDAILCWNELIRAGQNPSRNNLQNALIAKGFDCKENWARKFYEDIKEMLKDRQQKESAGR